MLYTSDSTKWKCGCRETDKGWPSWEVPRKKSGVTAWLLHLPQPSTYPNANTFPKHMIYGEDCYRMSNQESHTCFKGETEYTINTCNEGSQTILGNSILGKNSMRKWCSHWILHVVGSGKEYSRWMGQSVYKLGGKPMAHRKNHRTDSNMRGMRGGRSRQRLHYAGSYTPC